MKHYEKPEDTRTAGTQASRHALPMTANIGLPTIGWALPRLPANETGDTTTQTALARIEMTVSAAAVSVDYAVEAGSGIEPLYGDLQSPA